METRAEKPRRSAPLKNGRIADGLRQRRSHRPTKLQPLTRDALDGRSNAAKQFDAIASGIAHDLGGSDRLSTVQRHLVEAFAGAAINVHDLNARLLIGEKVDIVEHSQAISTMVRIAARIGVRRVANDVTPPSVDDYAAHINEAAE
jgi:hypothetical protein